MAVMIPDIDAATISNLGEQAFYYAACHLPDSYTVMYSYRYKDQDATGLEAQIMEADFVIVNPNMGYLVIEVKQGDVNFNNGVWRELKGNDYVALHKDPTEQARNAMFAILSMYTSKTNNIKFPLKIKYALAFPECSHISGSLPADLDGNSIILSDDLNRLEDKIFKIFGAENMKRDIEATKFLIDKVLAPSFKVFAKLEDKIAMFHEQSSRILTEEQERILEETELDKRKIFLGAAGTGKTFIAIEKAKRLGKSGKKVFLTCFNKNLAKHEFSMLGPNITAMNFHDYLEQTLTENGVDIPNVENLSEYYDKILPDRAFDFFMNIDESEKFDAIIIDEGQDFEENWIICIESMLKKQGEFYIFADTHQNLFNKDIDIINKMVVSKHKLTRNLRNTEEINKYLAYILPDVRTKTVLKGGLPVNFFKWQTIQQEKKMIENEIGKLVSQGIQPRRILILSPHKKENSCLSDLTKIKEWPLVQYGDTKSNSVKFCTIRSFKGLEADIVFLIGIRNESKACTLSDVYVGGSRARFLLYVFHEESWNSAETSVS